MLTGQSGFPSVDRGPPSWPPSFTGVFSSFLAPTYSSPAETKSTTSSLSALFQSLSSSSSWPVPATNTLLGFLRRSFDWAVLMTSARHEFEEEGSRDVEEGMRRGDFWDCLEFEAMVMRVEGILPLGVRLEQV